jgi:hypothetical protein
MKLPPTLLQSYWLIYEDQINHLFQDLVLVEFITNVWNLNLP